MAKRKKELTHDDKVFLATTLASMVSILKTRFTDSEIKKYITKKSMTEVCQMVDAIKEEMV